MRFDFTASTFVDLARRETRCELIYRFLSFEINGVSLFITSAFFSRVIEIVDGPRVNSRSLNLHIHA